MKVLIKKRYRNALAFSLVEVTLAIGLTAFCLTSLVGLFGVGLQASRQSTDDTTLSAAAVRLASGMAVSADFFSATDVVTGYCDADGVVTDKTANRLYQYTITKIPGTSTPPGLPDSLTRAKVTFSWPVPANKYSNAFYVTLPP